ncbi:MAG: hypothetical protein KIT34_17955, partial [Cyanobacteria bacterium TGS_CYA1]|nr:hypothetical protein [Cyanobacteria bacterium TGS_CYA1]
NRAEIKAYVAKQTKKDFVCADILTANEEDIKDVKAFLLTLGYKRVLFQKGQGIGYPCIIYDSLNHPLDRPEDSRKNEQKN